MFCVCKAEHFVVIQLWFSSDFPSPPSWLPKVTISGQQNARTLQQVDFRRSWLLFHRVLLLICPGPVNLMIQRAEKQPQSMIACAMLTADTASLWVAVVSQDACIVNMKRLDFGWGWGAAQANFAIKPRDICAF